MSRIPMIPVETGPIIAPALQAANQIREGRARVSMLETQAKGYPEEYAARRSILAEEVKRAPLMTQDVKQKVEAFPKQEARLEEAAKFDNAQKGLTFWEAAVGKIETAQDYNKLWDYSREKLNMSEASLGPKLPDDTPPEKVREHIERVVKPDLGKAKDDLKYKQDELKMREKGYKVQENVANIYAKSRADEAAEKRAADEIERKGIDNVTTRAILNDAPQSYREENYHNVGTEDRPEWKLNAGADSYTKWLPKYIKRSVDGILLAKKYGTPPSDKNTTGREPLEY